MAGSLCDGTPTNQPYVNASRAYCEGRAVAVAGGLIGDNPHATGSEDGTAWAKGFNSYNGGVGAAQAQDCCADVAYNGIP